MLLGFHESMFGLLPHEICEGLLERWIGITRPLVCLNGDSLCWPPSGIYKTAPSKLAYIMCASVVDGYILNKLRNAVHQLSGIQNYQKSLSIIAGILMARTGELASTGGSAPYMAGTAIDSQRYQSEIYENEPYQIISGGEENQSIYYTWAPWIRDPGDTITCCGIFRPGIHAWYLNTVHEPLNGKKMDPQRAFLIEWQGFTLHGQPGEGLRRTWMILDNGRLDSEGGDFPYILQDQMIIKKLQGRTIIGSLYLVGAMNHTRETPRLSYYFGFSIRQGFVAGPNPHFLVAEAADWKGVTAEITRIMGHSG